MTTPSRFLVLISFCAVLAGFARAQATSAAARPSAPNNGAAAEEAVELSPFVVNTGSDKGYVATSSLAGSRVNTQLKDIAAPIDVMTPEFLGDIAATNIDEAVLYSSNSGSVNEQNTGPNNGSSGSGSTRMNGRARGFDETTAYTDFYATNLPSDFYNIDRLTIAYGPQSILFGLGTSGGILDSTTKRATMRDRTELSFQTDNNGSARSTLDFNQELLPQKLAVRIAALDGRRNTPIEGGYNDQRRLFGTFTFKPLASTTVRVTAERMLQRASLPTNFVSQDFLTPWVEAGQPLFDNARGNAAIPNNNNHATFARNNNVPRVFSYGAADSNTLYSWSGSVLTKGPQQVPGAIDTRDQALIDNSIYPVDLEPRVGGKIARLQGNLLRAAIEQKLAENLFIELGLNYEKVKEKRGGPFFNAESVNIRADANRYLPGGTAAAPQTALNPNAGRLYIEANPAGQEQIDETREARLLLSYEYDFARHFQNFARWFGRHRLAGLYSVRRDDTRSQDARGVIIGDTPFTTGDLLNNSRSLRARYYLDPETEARQAGPLLLGVDPYFGPWTFTDAATGQPVTATMFDHPAGRTSAASGFRKDLNSYMLAVQSFFLKDRLNVFAGRRIDQFKTYELTEAARTRGDQLAAGDERGLFPTLGNTQFASETTLDDDARTYSYGAVAHITRNLSLTASRSNNTSLPSGFLGPDNTPLPGIVSTGYDIGGLIRLKNDAISLRVNFFKMDQTGQHQNDAQAVRLNSTTIEQRLRGPDRPAGIATVEPAGFDPITRGNIYRAVEDKVARGLDVMLVARLTNNWDARLTVGRQQTFVSNKSEAFNVWAESRLPVWQDFGGLGWDNVTISNTDSRTVHQYYDEAVATEIQRFRLRNNLLRYRQREWRANLFTNYRFTTEFLKGFNVGGGVRWADKPRTGFVQMPYGDGLIDDVTRPTFGDDELFFDAVVGYARTTRIFGGRKVDWKVQLNVRNLFNDDDIQGGVVRNDLEYLDWVRVEPRQIILTTTISF